MSRKTKEDPTGQRGNRKRSTKRLIDRLTIAEKAILSWLRSMSAIRTTQTVIQNELRLIYEYQATAQEVSGVVHTNLEKIFATQGPDMPAEWWWGTKDIEQPFRQGALDELNEFNRVISGTSSRGLPIQALPPELALFSRGYISGLRDAQVRNYGLIKNLGTGTAEQVVARINDGIQSGFTPTQIARDVRGRFAVAKSNAKRIADTEVNRAYNDARLDMAAQSRDATGAEVAVMHISSLLPTTRAHHASRHGNLYTAEQERQWWNNGTNRINCKCTTRSVLMKDGKVIDQELVKRIKGDKRILSKIAPKKPKPKPKAKKPKTIPAPERGKLDPLAGQGLKNNKEVERFVEANDLAGTSLFDGVKVENSKQILEGLIMSKNELPKLPAVNFYGSFAGGNKAAKNWVNDLPLADLKYSRSAMLKFNKDRMGKHSIAHHTYVKGPDGEYFFDRIVFKRDMANNPHLKDTTTGIGDFMSTNGNPLVHTAIHEHGHYVDRVLGIADLADIDDLYKELLANKKALSRYGKTNVAEMIAEAWAEFVLEDKPRDLAKAVGEIIQREYKHWIKKEGIL